MPTDREFLTNAIAGTTAATGAADPKSEARKALKLGLCVARVTEANTRAANNTYFAAITVPSSRFSNGIQLVSARVIPATNLTADNTNNVILQVLSQADTGGTQTVYATANTAAVAAGGLGDLTRGVAYSLTANVSNATVNAGSTVCVGYLNAATSAAAQQASGMVFEILYEVL